MSRLRQLEDADLLPALDQAYVIRRPAGGLGDDQPPPRILLLYGSLRERAFSRLAAEEAARLLQLFGAEIRIFDPSDLPLPDQVAGDNHPAVHELREHAFWSEGMVWCSPERHGQITGIMKAQIDHLRSLTASSALHETGHLFRLILSGQPATQARWIGMSGRKRSFTQSCKTAAMSFKKPFRAQPIKLGPYYLAQRARELRSARLRQTRFAVVTGVLSAITFTVVWSLSGPGGPRAVSRELAPVYYSGCDDARAAGAAPIYRWQPGYRPEMDGDSDGIACEPYRGW